MQVGVKILIRESDKYLFLRRSSSFKAGPQEWDIPGGRVEPTEQLGEALAREINEETGLILQATDALLAAQDIFVLDKSLHVVRLTYAGTAKGKVSISSEHAEYKWMTVAEALAEADIDPYLKEVLRGLSEN